MSQDLHFPQLACTNNYIQMPLYCDFSYSNNMKEAEYESHSELEKVPRI